MGILKFSLADLHTEILSQILTYCYTFGQIVILKPFLTEDILYFIRDTAITVLPELFPVFCCSLG